jgi:hypothetical protein
MEPDMPHCILLFGAWIGQKRDDTDINLASLVSSVARYNFTQKAIDFSQDVRLPRTYKIHATIDGHC